MKMTFPVKFLLFTIFLIGFSTSIFSQGSTCSAIEPFCSSNDPLIFSNCNDQDPTCNATAETGPDYGCLFSQPYPAWFFLQIDQTGDLAFDIIQNTSFDGAGNPNGTGLDVDFIAWGPFDINDNLCDYSLLQMGNEIDCSYSIASVEQFAITNAMPGEIYVLLITNFNQNPGFIKLEQTNFGTPGSGATDCSIVSDQGCEGTPLPLNATTAGAVNYVFTFDDGTNPPVEVQNSNNPIYNATLTGTYDVLITFAGGSSTMQTFNVIFNPQPVIASAAQDIFICDDGTNGNSFDLTQNDVDVLGGQDPMEFDNITYHNSQTDADNGASAIPNPTTYMVTGGMETIYVRIEDNSGSCFATDAFTVTYALVTVGVLTPVDACDLDGDGTVSLDLITLKRNQALNGQDPADYRVSFHPTQMDADGNTGALPNPYVTAVTPQQVFVRVENRSNTSCFGTDSFDISIVVAPEFVLPTPLEICDDVPNDGIAEFDLESKTDEITNGPNMNALVTYHLSQLDADSGMNPQSSPYSNVGSSSFQIMYVRIANAMSPSCYNTVELQLIVNDSPEIQDPIMDYVECDNDMDGSEIFDLTSKDVEILDGLVGVTLTYHTTEADAEAGVAAIMPPDMYPSAGELIWVRAQNYENGDPMGTPLCASVGSFSLVLGNVLNFTQVDTFEQCDINGDGMEAFDLSDQNVVITNGDANLNVSYYATQGDAMTETMPLAIPYTSTGEQIWVRVESNDEGCFVNFPMDLIVVPTPLIGMPDPLVFCDDNNDGFGEFMLNDATQQVLNGNPSGSLMVSYHISLDDAMNNVLPLPTMTLFNNDMVGMQTVFVRLSDSASGCYSTTPLDLIVRDSPAITPPGTLTLCDDDTDGRGIFDLTESEVTLFTGLDPLLYTVTYYDNAGLTNPITTPTAYPNTSTPQTIFIVVANNDPAMPDNICERQTTVELIVLAPATLIDPVPLEECDDDEITGINDELEFFDLTSKIDEIRGGNAAIAITFFESLAGAQDGSMPIAPATMYQNTSNPQTIYIRAEDINSGCVVADGMVTLDLIVNPVPVVNPPSILAECDDDTDGFISTFMLEDNNAEISTDPDVSFTYHETLQDAQNSTFAITSPYENVVAFNQQIFVRVTYTNPPNDTGCFTITPMDLEVLPSPQIAPLSDLEICDDDDMAVFNLNDQDAAIYNGQSLDFIITYHTSQIDADTGINDIINTGAFPNATNPQTIYVRFESDVNACFNTSNFDLVVNLGPAVTDPTQLMMCDDVGQANDGFTSFDLTLKNDEITGTTPGVSVEYYETMQNALDAIDRINPETDYTNTLNPQIVYVRVIAANGCVDFTTLELRVTANPVPVTPMPLELCDDNMSGDGIELFNLASTRTTILNGANWIVTYHANYQDAFDGMPEVPDELAYPNVVPGMDVAYARATNMTTGCFEIVEIQLIVNPLPDDTAIIEDYIICEVPFDGRAIFDLTSRVTEILGPDQDPGDYTVTYYLDATAAMNGMPIIGNATTYQNITTTQTIFTGIENNTTGCYSAGLQSFVIDVRAGAEATMPQEPFIICDNEGANDGIASFNLDDATDAQVADLRAEILGGQPEPDFVITFHETEAGAEAGTGAISFPYNNLINPQRVYVRVTNSLSDCFATTEMLIQVDILPIVTLDEQYRICVDEDDMVVMEEEGQPSPPTIDTGLDPRQYTFEWAIDGTVQVDQTGPSIVPMVGGVYMVTVTDNATGCINMATTTVTVSSAPRTFSAILVNGAFANNHIIEAEATGLGVYVFQLDDGVFQSSGTFEDVRPGTHIITIKDVNGCGSEELVINVIDFPEFMTPNHDGYHDTWNIIGIAEGDPTAKIYIFDRYGKLLKQLSPQSAGWDGTYNGNPLPSNDYWFRVEYMEDDTIKEFKGHFTLKR
jgi:gliding motility-associated-like protein